MIVHIILPYSDSLGAHLSTDGAFISASDSVRPNGNLRVPRSGYRERLRTNLCPELCGWTTGRIFQVDTACECLVTFIIWHTAGRSLWCRGTFGSAWIGRKPFARFCVVSTVISTSSSGVPSCVFVTSAVPTVTKCASSIHVKMSRTARVSGHLRRVLHVDRRSSLSIAAVQLRGWTRGYYQELDHVG